MSVGSRRSSGSSWLFSRSIDLLLLVVPVWATWAVCFLLPEATLERTLPLWVWAVFIVGIDVSHVWSTLFRTYLDREEFANHRTVLIPTPVLAFGLFFVIASISTLWFWRVLAYLAVYHFVKQQYGFFALYRARSGLKVPHRFIGDRLAIYLATLYPVVFWHLTTDRSFNWFVSGDFIRFQTLTGFGEEGLLLPLLGFANLLYWLVIAAWCAEEIHLSRTCATSLPVGRILWLLSTAGTWYLGIIHFNSDLVFSLTNVVAHGVPYLALVFFYVERKSRIASLPDLRARSPLRAGYNVLFMLAVVLFLAFGEEYLWDLFLYQERGALFEQLFAYPIGILESPFWQAAALALLSVPQVTHYIIDGFIWKNNARNPYLKQVLA
jgi:hypothetical protein